MITIQSTLARDPNGDGSFSGTHAIVQAFGPFRSAERGLEVVEGLFAKVMQPGEILTLEVLS